MKDLPYRFFWFVKPTHFPFDQPSLQWTTILAEFIASIVKTRPHLLFWYADEGSNFQFCFASTDYAEIEKSLYQRAQDMGITTFQKPKDGDIVASAFGGTRFSPKEKENDKDFIATRSEYILSVLHSFCRLHISCLVQEGHYWRLESNSDSQNPLGSPFESMFHLFSNISKAEFEVHLSTSWMRLPRGPSARLHL